MEYFCSRPPVTVDRCSVLSEGASYWLIQVQLVFSLVQMTQYIPSYHLLSLRMVVWWKQLVTTGLACNLLEERNSWHITRYLPNIIYFMRVLHDVMCCHGDCRLVDDRRNLISCSASTIFGAINNQYYSELWVTSKRICFTKIRLWLIPPPLQAQKISSSQNQYEKKNA